MSFAKNPGTGVYECDIKDRRVKRLHLSLKTKNQREAARRYAAVETAVRQDHPAVDRLRKQKLNIEALTACYEAGRSFDTLLDSSGWPTLGEATTDYVAYLREHPERAENTARNAQSQLGAALAHFGDEARLDAVLVEGDEAAGTTGTKEWHRTLKAGGRTDATVALHVQRLAALYRWVQGREDQRALRDKRAPRVLHTPIDWELVPKGRSKRVRFLTPGEAARLMAATPPRFRFAVAAGFLAGFRIEETAFLARADVDNTLGWLYVQPKPAPWLRRGEWKPKGKSAREVPLDLQLRPVLERHAATFAGERWLLPSFERAGRPILAHTIDTHFKRIVADAGLIPGRGTPEGVTYHTLRHTFASWLVMEGVDLLTVSRLLGHTTTTQVVATYAHLSPEHRAQAVARLGNRFTLVLPSETDSTVPDARPSQPETQE